MKKISSLILALLLCIASYAVPAWRGRITYTQPDGSTIVIQKHGDEFFHWTTDASGNVVELGDDGWYRPVSTASFNSRRNAAKAVRNARNRSRARRAGEHIALGQKHFLVILVEFSDVTFKSSTAKQDFYNLLNQSGYSVNGGTGSARDFYYENSHGVFEPIFDVFGPVQLKKTMSYYGANDSGGYDVLPEEAIIEGCKALNSEIDFTQYDNDGDGTVDLVFMYYAGYGEADGGSANTIWPHQWNLSEAGKSLTLDGKKIDSYACTNELIGSGSFKGKMCGIGTACHEFGHAMGLPDFYDVDYDNYNGEAGGLYDYSTMCGGSYNNEGRTPPYFNIEERIMLGWLEPDVIAEFPKSGNYTIPGINNNVTYKTPTDQSGEYFVYECRSNEGWDAFLPEHGMIVYHVDRSDRMVTIMGDETNISISAKNLWEEWWVHNSINENGSHPCFYIVPAGNTSSLNYSGSRFAFPGAAKATSFTPVSWNGAESAIKLSGIAYSGNQVSLYASVPSAALDYPVISNPQNGTYQVGDIFELSLIESESRPVTAVQWFYDDEPVSAGSVVLRTGTHTVEAVVTFASGDTQMLTLELSVD